MDFTTLEFPCGSIVLEGAAPPASSVELARRLPDCRDRSVLDLGCGTGLFALVAAKAGAREVWATDLDAEAAALAGRNAGRNGLAVRVERGDWFEPVGDRRFDLIVTNPPQTPAPGGARGPKFGGPDGLAHFERILREAPRHLEPGGSVYALVISLADTARFRSLAGREFAVRELGRMRRDFTRDEYAAHHPELPAYLEERQAEFLEDAAGLFFWVRYFEARLK